MDLPRRGAVVESGVVRHPISRCVALTGLLLCIAFAPSGAATANSRAASSHSSLFAIDLPPPQTEQDATLIQRSGIRTVRFGIPWSVIEPSPGAYRWAPLDELIARLARHHLNPLGFVNGTPDWAVPGGGPPATPGARRAYAGFIRAVVQRYGPGGAFWNGSYGGIPYRPISELQIWNEPNFPSYWGGRVSARAYEKLLRAAAHAVRGVSSKVKVVLAGLGPGLAKANQVPSWKFLAQLYKAGAARYFDIAADHPYGANVAAMKDQLRRFARVMRRHHDHAPLYITELGWSSGRHAGSHLEVGSARRQAKLLRGAASFVVRHARGLHIKRFFWFDWRDPPSSSPINQDGAFDFGLRHYDETPKPAWRAYVHFTRG